MIGAYHYIFEERYNQNLAYPLMDNRVLDQYGRNVMVLQ